MTKQLLHQCLETLEDAFSKLSVGCYVHGYHVTIGALHKELAKPEAEVVAYRFTENRGNGNTEFNYYSLDEVGMAYRDNCLEITPLFASPPDTEAKDNALRAALDALKRCYDVTEWPCNGETEQDKAIKQIESLGVK